MTASILQTFSVIVAAVSVILGITAWRRTLMGQRRFDLAEQVHEGFANIRSAITEIRSPFGYSGEGSTRQRAPSESEEDSKLLDQAFVAIERYRSRSDQFSKLLALRHRFSLYFGEDAAKPFITLNQIVGEILSASRQLSYHWPRQGRAHMTGEEFQEHLKRMHAAEAVFWEGSEDPDPLNPRIDEMVNSIDQTCRKVINPRRNFWAELAQSCHSTCAYFRRQAKK